MLLRILLITSIAIVTDDRQRRFQKKSIAISLSKHLGIAVTGLLIPTTLTMATSPTASDINKQSRGVSVVLLSLLFVSLFGMENLCPSWFASGRD
jgi:Ca2+/H+ antiporter